MHALIPSSGGPSLPRRMLELRGHSQPVPSLRRGRAHQAWGLNHEKSPRAHAPTAGEGHGERLVVRDPCANESESAGTRREPRASESADESPSLARSRWWRNWPRRSSQAESAGAIPVARSVNPLVGGHCRTAQITRLSELRNRAPRQIYDPHTSPQSQGAILCAVARGNMAGGVATGRRVGLKRGLHDLDTGQLRRS